MKKLFLTLAVVVVTFSAAAQTSEKLFNGKNLDNWSIYSKEMSNTADDIATVKSRCIHISGKYGYVYTHKEYANYKLTLEWRWVGEPVDSGIFLNMQGTNKAWPQGYEVQLKPARLGDIYNFDDAKSDESVNNKYGLCKATGKAKEKSAGKWNTAEVVSSVDKITAYVNGRKVNEINNPTQNSGHIGLQSEGGVIEFRNVEVVPIVK